MPLVEQYENRHPEVAARADELSADKAYDSKENNEKLYDDHGIKPVIDNREDNGKPRTLFGERYDVFAYDEHGRVYCTCPKTSEQRELSLVILVSTSSRLSRSPSANERERTPPPL